MSFLPIIQRELSVAARRRSSFRVRWWTTAAAIIFSLLALIILQSASARGGAGPNLFGVITWYSFLLCLLSGAFITADSLSSEKREGTLGLLFLSDLRGYDVVLGKFAAQALKAFYCLLALLPAAALTLLLGGVTGGQFWRTALALANVLYVSLALGICVSAFARDGQRSVGTTLVLLVLLAAGPPLVVWVGRRLGIASGWAGISWLSPGSALSLANGLGYSTGVGQFWWALLSSSLLGCVFLVLASVTLPRAWQQSTEKPSRADLAMGRVFRQNLARRLRTRGEVLTRNPVQWLTSGQLGAQWVAWAVVAAWGVVVLLSLAFGSGAAGSTLVSSYLGLPFGFLLKVMFGIQATRFFREGRRDGALALLLCTPLSSREIVTGYAKALWGVFMWPLVTFVALLFAPVAIRLVTAAAAHNLDQAYAALSGGFLSALSTVRLGMDLLALCWFGMALALTSRRPSLSPASTVLFVLVLPSIFSFCWLDVVADIFFIAWGVAKLQDLRRWTAFEYQLAPVTGRIFLPGAALKVPPIIVN